MTEECDMSPFSFCTRMRAPVHGAVPGRLAKVTIPGRMEMVSQTPRVIVDGAHNAASLDAMMPMKKMDVAAIEAARRG